MENRRPLDGSVLTDGAAAYMFVEADVATPVKRVTYFLDGALFSIDSTAPFDFAGTSRRRPCRNCAKDANPFESNLLSLGEHRISAIVTFRDRSQTTVSATFTVADTTSHSLAVSSTPSRSSAVPLEGATLSGRRYVFLGQADDAIAGLMAMAFLLDGRIVGIDASAPYDAVGTGRNGLANALDTRRLRNGPHRLTAIAILDGGFTIVYSADFTIAN